MDYLPRKIPRASGGWQLSLTRRSGYLSFRWMVDLAYAESVWQYRPAGWMLTANERPVQGPWCGLRPLDTEVSARVVSRQLVLPALALAKYYQQREKSALDLLEKKERDIGEAKAALANTSLRIRMASWRSPTHSPDRNAHCHVVPSLWRE